MLASRETFPLLAELLAEQTRLDTPVARFSSAHDSGAPSQLAALNSQLIPLTAPGPGEQYAFEVDLDSCTGCKACVSACHSLNGLDETETWRDVGQLVGQDPAHPFTQTVTTACHHCEDPACLNGCPVLAYEKDPATGIVRHLDDQCIGCSYCILKCPYDVPKFSSRLGIVRKCDLCHSRLAAGEAPACAQACPTHAIRIVTISTGNRSPETGYRKTNPVFPTPNPELQTPNSVAAAPASNPKPKTQNPKPEFFVSGFPSPQSGFLPAAPDPAYTRPTTRYVSRRPLPAGLQAADARALRVQPAHAPLAVMLTLLPAAIGLSAVAAFHAAATSSLPAAAAAPDKVTYWVTLSAAALGATGLAASVFHLGQPLRAWRIFLGWRRSWLSREALLFGLWFGLALAAAAAELRAFEPGLPPDESRLLKFTGAAVGVVALVCSAMIYVDTRRRFWRAAQTFPRFFGTAAMVAAALISPAFAALLMLAKVALELSTARGANVSARLQRGPLRNLLAVRLAIAAAAIIALVIVPGPWALIPLLAGEFAERLLFFRAVDAPKMPGQPA